MFYIDLQPIYIYIYILPYEFILFFHHQKMKLQLKHLGYGLLTATLLVNLWFYQGTLFPSLYPNNDQDQNMILAQYPAQSTTLIQYSGGNSSWKEESTGTDDAFNILNNSHFNYTAVILNQIHWLQQFATVMFDVMAIALALFFIKHDSK